MHDRDREAFVRRGRDPDVVVFLQHDLAAFVVHGCVQRGEFFQSTEDRFDEEREEGELEALPFRGLLQMVPQVDQLGHVHFFDVREMGGGGGAVDFAGAEGTTVGRAGAVGLVGATSPASPNTMRVAPTFTTSPSFARSWSTLPVTGEGIWTVTLSVITSTTGSFSRIGSPSLTNHLTTSPSWTPSPMSGSLNSRAIGFLVSTPVARPQSA